MNEPNRHLLFLAHRLPFPPNKGDKIRSFNEVKYLAENGWNVHLCCLVDDPSDLCHVESLKRWCASVFAEPIDPVRQRLKSLVGPLSGRPLSVPYFYSPPLQRRVDALLDRFPVECIFGFSGPMAEYVFRSRWLVAGRRPLAKIDSSSGPPRDRGSAPPGDHLRAPRLVMDLVDVDSDKWAQYAKSKAWPLKWVYGLEAWLLARYERKVARTFDATLLVSRDEAAFFRTRVGEGAHVVDVGNGVDLEYFHPNNRGSKTVESIVSAEQPPRPATPAGSGSPPPRLVFCGAMDYHPNVDAVVWFAREVLPLVRRRLPGTSFTIVGSNPSPEVVGLQKLDGVTVTGRVEDVRPYVGRADVSVAPIRIARGIQNKVLEAMALGRPVVSSPEAFEGIEAQPDRDLVVAPTDSAKFSQAVVALLEDPARAALLGQQGRRTVCDRYGWAGRLAPLGRLVAGARQVGAGPTSA